MLVDFLITFTIGSVGALIMVYLRWIGVLPRFKSAIETDQLEGEYEEIRKRISEKMKAGESPTPAEIEHSNNLRDDIRRQKTTGFLGWAAMYVILGGAVASLFLGETIQNLGEVDKVVKVASAGAFWTSFLSILDARVAERRVEELRSKSDKEIEEKIDQIKGVAQKEIEKANITINESNQKMKKLVETYNLDVEQLTDAYNNLLEKYTKISGRQKSDKDTANAGGT
jgi:hypothetical protein